MPIEDRIEQLLARLSETEACGFEDLFADVQSRSGLIVTFLAMLEMIRLKLVRVFQTGAMGPIRVYKRARPADAPSFGKAQDGPEPVEGPKPILDPEQRHEAEASKADAEK
jgi:segregation and condensation protein A